jgi:hypothetical protein
MCSSLVRIRSIFLLQHDLVSASCSSFAFDGPFRPRQEEVVYPISLFDRKTSEQRASRLAQCCSTRLLESEDRSWLADSRYTSIPKLLDKIVLQSGSSSKARSKTKIGAGRPVLTCWKCWVRSHEDDERTLLSMLLSRTSRMRREGETAYYVRFVVTALGWMEVALASVGAHGASARS